MRRALTILPLTAVGPLAASAAAADRHDPDDEPVPTSRPSARALAVR